MLSVGTSSCQWPGNADAQNRARLAGKVLPIWFACYVGGLRQQLCAAILAGPKSDFASLNAPGDPVLLVLELVQINLKIKIFSKPRARQFATEEERFLFALISDYLIKIFESPNSPQLWPLHSFPLQIFKNSNIL